MIFSVEENTRPNLSIEEIKTVMRLEFGLGEILQIEPLAGYDDQNLRIMLADGTETVLKITNWKDSENRQLLNEVTNLMTELGRTVPCSVPKYTILGKLIGSFSYLDSLNRERTCAVRLFNFLSGSTIKVGALTRQQAFQWGSLLGKIHTSTKDMNYPTIMARSFLWSWQGVLEVRQHVNVHKSPSDKDLILRLLDNYERVNERLKEMPHFILHGDLNEHNILASTTGEIYAALDFGDVHGGPLIWDVALVLAYIGLVVPDLDHDLFDYYGSALAGYCKHFKDHQFIEDLDLIRTLVCARLAQSITLGLKTFELTHDPYVISSQERGWPCLRKVFNEPDENIMAAWSSVFEKYGLKSRHT